MRGCLREDGESPLTRIASASLHATWPKLRFGILKNRPPKAAYASPRKRGEVTRKLMPAE